jgi:hypothetical protein
MSQIGWNILVPRALAQGFMGWRLVNIDSSGTLHPSASRCSIMHDVYGVATKQNTFEGRTHSEQTVCSPTIETYTILPVLRWVFVYCSNVRFRGRRTWFTISGKNDAIGRRDERCKMYLT